jgi:hypothetical protein
MNVNITKMGFQNFNTIKWSTDLINRFNSYQTTMNNNINQFNLEQLQRQATPAEAEEYLKNGYWYWPDDLKNLYIQKVLENPIIKINPQYALNYAMALYNQNAVKELLAWNTKEGQLLLYGVRIPPNMNASIKCSADLQMEKTVYNGMNLWNGYTNSTTTIIKPENIPNEIPGFSFIKEPCNPCVAFNTYEDVSCPFKINIKGDDTISKPWKYLWNI